LLTQASNWLPNAGWRRHSHQQIILELAHAAGSLQLIAGQVADWKVRVKKPQPANFDIFMSVKPQLCFVVPCARRMAANCTSAQLKALTDFGYNVGLAFQIIDDILDVTQTANAREDCAKTLLRKKPHTLNHWFGKIPLIAQQLTERAFRRFGFSAAERSRGALAAFLLERDSSGAYAQLESSAP